MQRGSINLVILLVKPAMDLSALHVQQVSAEGETAVATEPTRHSFMLVVVCVQMHDIDLVPLLGLLGTHGKSSTDQ